MVTRSHIERKIKRSKRTGVNISADGKWRWGRTWNGKVVLIETEVHKWSTQPAACFPFHFSCESPADHQLCVTLSIYSVRKLTSLHPRVADVAFCTCLSLIGGDACCFNGCVADLQKILILGWEGIPRTYLEAAKVMLRLGSFQTPEILYVWQVGFSCASHSQEGTGRLSQRNSDTEEERTCWRESGPVSPSPPRTVVCLKYELWQIMSQIGHHFHILTYRELKWLLQFLARTKPVKCASGFCEGTDIWHVGVVREIHCSLKECIVLQCYVQRAIITKQFWMFHLHLLSSTKLSDINASNDRNKALSLIIHLVYWIRIIGRLRWIHWSTLSYKISHVFEHLQEQANPTAQSSLEQGTLLAYTSIPRARLWRVLLHHLIVTVFLVENDFTCFFIIIHRSVIAAIDKERANIRHGSISNSKLSGLVIIS